MSPRTSLPLLLMWGLAHSAKPQAPQSPDDFKLSVSVDLVALHAAV
jgi:hypothetical protein